MKNKQYTVTQMSEMAGVSKASISRWLATHNVSPETTKGKRKYFNATYLEQYIKEHKQRNSKDREAPSPTDLLISQITQLKSENAFLRRQIEKKDEQLSIKDEQIKISNQLVDQAQRLNLLDKPKNDVETSNKSSSLSEEIDNSSEKATNQHSSWFSRLFNSK